MGADGSDAVVMVGVDGSPESAVAVGYAADEARLRQRPLHLVHVLSWPVLGGTMMSQAAVSVVEEMRDAARHILDSAQRQAQARAPELETRTVLLDGGAAAELVRASSHALLLVLGRRGHGGFASLLLGSVSTQVSAHAESPVMVVPAAETVPDSTVVVGVDGSASSPAIECAFEEAAARLLPLAVVYAWSVTAPDPDTDPIERHWEATADAVIAESLADWPEKYPDVPVRRIRQYGSPERVLLSQVTAADVLVVGTRGLGGFRGLVLGSTSQAMLRHAPCPVIVARRRGQG